MTYFACDCGVFNAEWGIDLLGLLPFTHSYKSFLAVLTVVCQVDVGHFKLSIKPDCHFFFTINIWKILEIH